MLSSHHAHRIIDLAQAPEQVAAMRHSRVPFCSLAVPSLTGLFPGPLVWLLALAAVLFCGSGARADWPEFRGPLGDGQAAAPGDTNLVGLPLHWSETNNIKWKTEIPYRGWSTPVVLGGQIWLTTATEDGHDFFAIKVDAETGEIRFNEKIFHSEHPEPLGNG